MKRYFVRDGRDPRWPYDSAPWEVVDRETDEATYHSSRARAREVAAERNKMNGAEVVMIFRVGHKHDRNDDHGIAAGPYIGRYDWDKELCMWRSDTPPPSADGLNDIEDSEVCGFHKPEWLVRWFLPALDSLAKAGYAVHVYTVPGPAVRVGGHQVVFQAAEARLERVLEIEEFLGQIGAPEWA